MARAIDQIQAELASAYQPQSDLVNQQIAELPAYYQAQTQGLDTAKENSFRDITNQASARGIAYSGMPIAEQTRYLGSTYLPALAGLAQQQNQQRYSLQTTLNDINTQRLTRAQALQQQELDREQLQRQYDQQVAQQERQFQQQQAASRASYGGSSAATAPSIDDAVELINQLRQSGQYGDSGYGSIAQALQNKGYDITRNSTFDVGLRKAYGFGWQ